MKNKTINLQKLKQNKHYNNALKEVLRKELSNDIKEYKLNSKVRFVDHFYISFVEFPDNINDPEWKRLNYLQLSDRHTTPDEQLEPKKAINKTINLFVDDRLDLISDENINLYQLDIKIKNKIESLEKNEAKAFCEAVNETEDKLKKSRRRYGN